MKYSAISLIILVCLNAQASTSKSWRPSVGDYVVVRTVCPNHPTTKVDDRWKTALSSFDPNTQQFTVSKYVKTWQQTDYEEFVSDRKLETQAQLVQDSHNYIFEHCQSSSSSDSDRYNMVNIASPMGRLKACRVEMPRDNGNPAGPPNEFIRWWVNSVGLLDGPLKSVDFVGWNCASDVTEIHLKGLTY